jgi:hypothetical protein
MKLIFSFLVLFIVSSAWCRDIILIEHIENQETAKLVKKILITKFQIPEKLIQTTGIKNQCSIQTEAILHLCILKDGELEIKKMNKYILSRSFNIFINQSELNLKEE